MADGVVPDRGDPGQSGQPAPAPGSAPVDVGAAGLLNPLIAGAAMALSSVFVVSNSLRLRRFQAATSPAGR